MESVKCFFAGNLLGRAWLRQMSPRAKEMMCPGRLKINNSRTGVASVNFIRGESAVSRGGAGSSGAPSWGLAAHPRVSGTFVSCLIHLLSFPSSLSWLTLTDLLLTLLLGPLSCSKPRSLSLPPSGRWWGRSPFEPLYHVVQGREF